MKRRQCTTFFGTRLILPSELLKICLSYCCYWYCETCDDVYPQNFKCLSCPTLSCAEYHTGAFEYTTDHNLNKFKNFMDQLVWDYVEAKLPKTRTRSSGGWAGSNELTHRLQLKVDRKRTRSNQEWWAGEFAPQVPWFPQDYTPFTYQQKQWYGKGLPCQTLKRIRVVF